MKNALDGERSVSLRLIVAAPLDPERYGAAYGLQDNSTTSEWAIHPGTRLPNGDLQFDLSCRVRSHPKTGAPNFLGPWVHGDSARRFLYVSWRPKGWRPDQAEPTGVWQRRLKVHLSPISWEQIDAAIAAGGFLEGTVPGTGRDGGPSCASVPLVGGGWTVTVDETAQSTAAAAGK
jgi:Family of unknown function (DUF5990)